jgi:5S rRNA maturation endonuclease (ribonuclease M5)
VLYNLPQIVAAPADATIYLCEGEKDADRLNAILAGSGSVATTAPMGSRKWRPSYTEVLRGRDIIIFWDRDEPGRKHADIVAAALAGIARTVKLVNWDALWPVSKEIEGKIDLSDFLVGAVWKETGEGAKLTFAFNELLTIARADGCFEFIAQDEPTGKKLAKERSMLGKQFRKFAGRTFTLGADTKINFSLTGSGHSREYKFTKKE